MMKPLPTYGFVTLLLPVIATAQELAVGDQAPPLQIEKWVKGEKVEALHPGRIYVVEFWATWCGPCIASMPHLSALQAAFADKGVTIIGVAGKGTNDELAKVEAMVADKGGSMAYTVAWDDDGKTAAAYLKAAGQGGIPCSFLVDDKGKVAYIGHPSVLDIPLAEVVAGTWNPAEADERIAAAMEQLEEVVDALIDDADEGKKALDAFARRYPTMVAMVDDLLFPKLLEQEQFDRAYAVAKRVVEHAIAEKDAMKLNEISWAIVDPQAELAKRDLDVAMAAAEKAVELTKEKDGAILDTLARVWFWKKDYQKAVELQRKAVAVSERPDVKQALAEYEKLVAEKGAEKGADK